MKLQVCMETFIEIQTLSIFAYLAYLPRLEMI